MVGRWFDRPSDARAGIGSDQTGRWLGASRAHAAGGHMTWACRQCGAVVYAPPIGPRCRVLHGAAAVR
jgi:hypothetical protein